MQTLISHKLIKLILGIFLFFSTTLYASSIGDVVLKEGNSVIQRVDKTEVKDVIMEIFATSNKQKSLTIIENHRKLWLRVIGTRGHVGKKTINSSTQYNALFE